MKTSTKIFLLLLPVVALFIRARHSDSPADLPVKHVNGIVLPADVKAVVDNKCYGCHSVDGQSDDAKEGLMWDSIPHYSKARQIAVLDDIAEVLEKNEMPPAKFLESHPDAKISPAESKLLQKWAENTADELMK